MVSRVFLCGFPPLLSGMDLASYRLRASTYSVTELFAQRGGSFLTSSRRIIPRLCNHDGTKVKETLSMMSL